MPESQPPPAPSPALRTNDLRLATSLVALATSKLPAVEAVFGDGGVFPTAVEPRVRLALGALLYQIATTAPAVPAQTPFASLAQLFSYIERTLDDGETAAKVATGLRAAQLVPLTEDPATFDSLCGTTPTTEAKVAEAILATIVILVDQLSVVRHVSPYAWFAAFAARQEMAALGVPSS